jgi:Na+-driven multidrug efflux pump
MAAPVLASYVWLVGSAVGADNPDPVPEANDVTAGWIAALVFAFLIVAVVFLARSFVKQLRKAQAAREAGVYGDPPTSPPTQPRPDAASQ